MMDDQLRARLTQLRDLIKAGYNKGQMAQTSGERAAIFQLALELTHRELEEVLAQVTNRIFYTSSQALAQLDRPPRMSDILDEQGEVKPPWRELDR